MLQGEDGSSSPFCFAAISCNHYFKRFYSVLQAEGGLNIAHSILQEDRFCNVLQGEDGLISPLYLQGYHLTTSRNVSITCCREKVD